MSETEKATVQSNLDEERWIMTGSSKGFRHIVIPARAKGDKLTLKSGGFRRFLNGEVKFLVVKKEGIVDDGHGDKRWEGECYTLDSEKHKKNIVVEKAFTIILNNDNTVEVEYKDKQGRQVKQKLEPAVDNKVYHEAVEYIKAGLLNVYFS